MAQDICSVLFASFLMLAGIRGGEIKQSWQGAEDEGNGTHDTDETKDWHWGGW